MHKITKKIFLPLVTVAATTVPFISTSCVYPGKFKNIPVTDDKLFFSSNN
jgi:hypothetical protein